MFFSILRILVFKEELVLPILIIFQRDPFTWHHDEALHVVLQPGPLAAGQGVDAADGAAHLALAAPRDHEVSVPGFAAVLIKQHGAGPGDGRLKKQTFIFLTIF